MSRWQAVKAERNRQSLDRLNRALPGIFPSAVLGWAIGRPFVPPTPRLAIDSYWRAQPIRADRRTRRLAARSGPPTGWTWQIDKKGKDGLPTTYRTPPAPYREDAYAQGSGFCCICGQPVYRFGWHVDLWDSGSNMNANGTGQTPWPNLLSYWGPPNFQVINSDVHAAKCAIEARGRRVA